MPLTYVMYLGSNQFVNCDSVLKFKGSEVFRIRERDSDGKIQVDFDLHGKAGDRIFRVAKVWKNRVVYQHPNFEVFKGPDLHWVKGPVGNHVLHIESNGSNAIQIFGDFYFDAHCSLLARPGYTLLNTKSVRNAMFRRVTSHGLTSGIAIDDHSVSLG